MKKTIILISSFIVMISLFLLTSCGDSHTISKSKFSEAMKFYQKDNYKLTVVENKMNYNNEYSETNIYERYDDTIKNTYYRNSSEPHISYFRVYDSFYPIVSYSNSFLFENNFYDKLSYNEETNKYNMYISNVEELFGFKDTSVNIAIKFEDNKVVSLYCEIVRLHGSSDILNYTIEYDTVESFEKNLPEYLYDVDSNVPGFGPILYLVLISNLKVKTDIDIKKEVEINYNITLNSFGVDDPELTSLSTKKILERYSDFNQKLSYQITKCVSSRGEKYSNKSTVVSEDIVYSKEDTLGYLVSDDFAKDFPSSFTFNVNDLPKTDDKYFTVSYRLTIKSKDDEGIKLLRPLSSREKNSNYLYDDSIKAGDPISYIYASKYLEKQITVGNYYRFYVEDDKIHILPYEDISRFIQY